MMNRTEISLTEQLNRQGKKVLELPIVNCDDGWSFELELELELSGETV